MDHCFKLFFICGLFAGCEAGAQKEVQITIINNSTRAFDSISISTYGMSITFKQVLPNQKMDSLASITYTGSYEGAFLLKAFVKDSLIIGSTFGYFSSSAEINRGYSIEILPDLKLKQRL